MRKGLVVARVVAAAVGGLMVQIDFSIRSPQQHPKNNPNREVFMHFFGMEVTWQ